VKFSERWLREFVDPDLSTQALVDQLTMAGLEVDGVEPVAAALQGVVVGEIVAVNAHENADKLLVCTVDGGQGLQQVVCGAPNARVGIKVPYATIGAKLEDFKIKKAKLRGVESFGMLCSERELGLSDNHDGLMELPLEADNGMDIVDYLTLDDTCIEVDLTPNRGDCLGIKGIARETGLLNNLDLKITQVTAVKSIIEDIFPVHLDCPQTCPRFVGRIIRDVDLSVPSPLWLQEKLRRSGIRSIDSVVDVTNFVMLELNQPMHAYDLDRLDGGITVRLSKRGEQMTLLDGSSVELLEDTTLITDKSGPVGMAGIMGGDRTAVSTETKNIFLEAAFFTPLGVAGKARSYGMHTDACHRFERGVDYHGQVDAIERASALLLSIGGGKAGPTVDVSDQAQLPVKAAVKLRSSRVRRVLGTEIASTEIENILGRLDFPYSRIGTDDDVCWEVLSPSHRFDIAIEADLIEEVSRVYGYNNLPVTTPVSALRMLEAPEAAVKQFSMKKLLAARGYHEAITYSFVDEDLQGLLNSNDLAARLKNPLSADMAVMRTSLWSGLLKSAAYNQNRQQSRVRLFELGMVFRQSGETLCMESLVQELRISGLITGRRRPENWAETDAEVDFYDLKGDVEYLLGSDHAQEYEFHPCEHPALQTGQSARVLRNGNEVGYLGLLNSQVQARFDLRSPCYLFEFGVSEIGSRTVPQVNEVSRFPEIRRDIAVIVDSSIASSELRQVVTSNAGAFFHKLKLFDVYVGKGIENNSKSIGMGLTFQHPSRTLKDEEVNSAMEQIVTVMKTELNAKLRD
jgi:phenylalanyl-tRNA synthetase beta chain